MTDPHLPPPRGNRAGWGRPEHILGEPVAAAFLLARSATAAVMVQHITAFPNGFEFQVVAHFVVAGDVWDPMHGLAGLHGRPGDRPGELSEEHLRLYVRFSDGSEANNLGPPVREPSGPGPFLQFGRGSAGGAVAETTFWLWPLPPAGPITFACEWPKYHIPLTRHEFDGKLIHDAGQRATELWPQAEGDA
jgi:hypothetical protein